MERSLVLIKPDAMKRNLAGAIIARFQDFLWPSTLFRISENVNSKSVQSNEIKRFQPRFDLSRSEFGAGSGYRVDQHWAKSFDGEMIPYFVVLLMDQRVSERTVN